MSQRTLQVEPQPAASQVTSPYRDLALRALAITGACLVMAALSYDMVSGGWIGAAGPHTAVALVLVLSVLPLTRRVRYLNLTVLYVFALFVYTILRSFADKTAIPIRTEYVIQLDRLLFLGHQPTQWLQARLFDPTRLRPLDWLTVQVHWSYFAVPHVAAALVFLRRRDLFPRFVALILGTFYVGLVIYFLVPTAPPWLAADRGLLPGVARVMDFVGGQVDPSNYHRLYDALGVPNPTAAMPSLHMAVTFAVFLFARDLNRWLGRVALVYAVLMGFSLVYMGEHYATDVLVGVLIAYGVYRAVRHVSVPAPEPEPVDA